MKVEVYGNIRTEVRVDPIQVLDHLIEHKLGYGCWLKEEDDKYYKVWEEGRNLNFTEEISKEKYDLIKSLQNSLNLLKKYNEL